MTVRLVPMTPNPNLALELKAFARVDCSHGCAIRSREVGRLSGSEQGKEMLVPIVSMLVGLIRSTSSDRVHEEPVDYAATTGD